MKYMLDTDICIYIIKNNPARTVKNFRKHLVSDMCISAITYAELENGICKSRDIRSNRAALLNMLTGVKIMPFDAKAALLYGDIRSNLEIKGETIGPNDMLIAAHAKSLGLTLITNNTKEFNRVPGLKVENWT